jgi:hypothetical protein
MAAYRSADATVSAHGSATITPSDATVFPVCRELYVGVAGDLTVRMADGMTQLYTAAYAGYHPLQVDMVLATGTAATNIVALY